MKKAMTALGAATLVVLLLAAYNLGYHYVHWTPTEPVRFDSKGTALAGTLIKPSGEGPFPAVLLLHGSGPEVRGDPANNIIINRLARNGVASLTYDKRGAGESGGDFESATYGDFIDDALAALRYLQERPDIDGDRVGLYTVSESGWFGPEISARNGNVAFLANKVGCPLPWVDAVAWEVRNDSIADGFAPADADRIAALAKKRWSYYQDAARDPGLATGARRDALNAEIARLRASIPGAEDALPAELMAYDAAEYREFAEQSSYDPRRFIEDLDIPMFFAYGGLDINMPSEKCVAWLEDFRARTGRDVTVELYPRAGHSLFHWTGITTLGFVPAFVSAVSDWIVDRATGEAVAND